MSAVLHQQAHQFRRAPARFVASLEQAVLAMTAA
jgi:hypothetical protein